jgi:putative endonuclease
MKQPCVYIMANRPRGTLYVGVTSHVQGRVWQHKHNVIKGFTQKYSLDMLVWCELHDTMPLAIAREKQIKAGSRQKKIDLVEMFNPKWLDLYDEIL